MATDAVLGALIFLGNAWPGSVGESPDRQYPQSVIKA
jgi:hypothetical protein